MDAPATGTPGAAARVARRRLDGVEGATRAAAASAAAASAAAASAAARAAADARRRPRTYSSSAVHFYFVVAAEDEDGARAVASRLQTRLPDAARAARALGAPIVSAPSTTVTATPVYAQMPPAPPPAPPPPPPAPPAPPTPPARLAPLARLPPLPPLAPPPPPPPRAPSQEDHPALAWLLGLGAFLGWPLEAVAGAGGALLLLLLGCCCCLCCRRRARAARRKVSPDEGVLIGEHTAESARRSFHSMRGLVPPPLPGESTRSSEAEVRVTREGRGQEGRDRGRGRAPPSPSIRTGPDEMTLVQSLSGAPQVERPTTQRLAPS